jgi:DNA-binding GntR family transcriptional regulator
VQAEPLSPIPIEILRARVANELWAATLRGNLPPGSQVKQEELAAQLRVSREPVRQALFCCGRDF